MSKQPWTWDPHAHPKIAGILAAPAAALGWCNRLETATGDAIVGKVLCVCAAAAALAQQGWQCTLFDRREGPAQETSGNPAGLFHGIVNAQDGVHARFNRAAALEAQRRIAQAIAAQGVGGDVSGLLRLETSGVDAAAMKQVLDRLGLPEDYVQALDAGRAAALAGIGLRHPAWFYPGGGWVRPAQWSKAMLDTAAGAVEFRGGTDVQSLSPAGERWQLRDAAGDVIAEADVVVLANAGDALRLLGSPAWPLQRVRGQLSMGNTSALPPRGSAPPAPCPIRCFRSAS